MSRPADERGIVVRQGDWSTLGPHARAVRLDVFVREQGIAPELEMDDRDATAWHAVAFAADGSALATGRLLPDAHIGRMAVIGAMRGQGLGARILQALLAAAQQRGMGTVRLHAQVSAAGFYARQGFVAEGGLYQEAGIDHQTMARDLGKDPVTAIGATSA